MIWVKTLHIFFIIAWFAGLFYLPRLFVNHVMTEEEPVKQRLAIMERKLYRFITPWMALTVIFGLWMLIDYAWLAYSHLLWLKLKLGLVAILIAYHFYCGRIMRQLANNTNQRSHIWFRWFNEFPVLILAVILVLTMVKPL
jgi:putative membrane protein